MRPTLTATVIMAVCLMLAGCSLPERGPTYPPPTVPPQPGDEWASDDEGMGFRLNADGTATTWGIPWYTGSSVNCNEAALNELSATVPVEITLNDGTATVSFIMVVQDDEEAFGERSLNFYRSKEAPGWQVFEYEPCIEFNDGLSVSLTKRE